MINGRKTEQQAQALSTAGSEEREEKKSRKKRENCKKKRKINASGAEIEERGNVELEDYVLGRDE